VLPSLVFATRCAQQRRDLFIFNRTGPAGAQFIVKTLHTPLEETTPPFPDRRFGPLQTVGDLAVTEAFRRPENHFGAGDQGMRQRARSSQTGQLNAFILTQNQLGFRATNGHVPGYSARFIMSTTYGTSH
jgi:hypothetical protein